MSPSRLLARSRAAVTATALGAALVSGGWLLQRGLERGDAAVSRARLFDQVFTRVANDYVDSLGTEVLYTKAVNGMLDQLHDPHSVYLTPERLATLDASTSGSYAGLGIQIDIQEAWIGVIAVMPGTPALRGGIQAGDRIVGVDGRPTRGLTADEALTMLRGPRGSRVTLTVERPGVLDAMRFTLQRAEIRVSPVQHALLLPDSVGYVNLTIFSESTTSALRAAVARLRGRGMRLLVLDLRNNPGGLLEQGVEASDLFLDPGQRIVSMRGRAPGSTAEFVDRAAQAWPGLPVVVLVNGSTASAAEIVSGALQDHDRAVIVGATTYGKGSAQSIFSLGANGALKLTTARWYTPAGRSIQKQPADTAGPADADVPDSSAGERPLGQRIPYRTDMGRTVYGGGGITPDLIVTDTAAAAAELAFWRSLGESTPAFRAVLNDYALAVKQSGQLRDAGFAVTPRMMSELWRRLQARSVVLPRTAYEANAAVVARLLGREIARYTFGPEGEFRRQLRDDRVLAAALDLARGAPTQRELLTRAARLRAAKREDVSVQR